MNDNMKTSQNGLEFISRWEGCVLKPYKDIAGLRTIGVGHLIKPGENFPDGVEITKEHALDILSADVKLCEDAINLRIKVSLSQNQFDALVSFGFNCGTGVYTRSDACKALNEGKYDEVPQRILVWSKARINGKLQTNQGLYNRRKSEGELFINKDSADSVSMPATKNVVQLSSVVLKEIQTILKRLGLYTLKIDGAWGKGTQNALQTFASQKCLCLTDLSGKTLTTDVLDALRKS